MISKRIKDLRESKQLSHDKLADVLEKTCHISVSRESLIRYEKNEEACHKMSADKLAALAQVFGVTTDYLLGRSQYQSADMERFTAGAIGLSEKATISMLGDTSIVPALNLLVERGNFEPLLKAMYLYYHACEADCVKEETELFWREVHQGEYPTDQQLAQILTGMALDDSFSYQTQANLFTLSERLVKRQETTIFTSEDEDNVFLNQLQMKDLYEVLINKHLHKTVMELEKRAVKQIRSVLVNSNDLDTY